MRALFFFLALVLYFALIGLTSFTVYESLSCVLFMYFLFNFINDLGSRLVILDILILISIFICLCMPIVGYHWFNNRNQLATLWNNYMRVTSEEYFSFMLPATVAMIIGLKLPIFFRKQTFKNHEQYMINAKNYLSGMKWQGLIMVIVGLIASLLEGYVPDVIGYILFLLKYLMFVGVFYCLYSTFPNKRTIMIFVFGLLIFRSIYGGMFGEMVYMGVMTVILVLLGNKTLFITKFSIMIAGVFCLLILQSVKPAYRNQIWKKEIEGQKVSLFSDMMLEKASSPLELFKDERTLFLFYTRFNQGQIVSRVLESVPHRFSYADGETIYLSLAASIVPRFLWQDKPESGGLYNFKRFLGVTLRGYSIGLSPFGEAWGNFGKSGGIFFMLCFGLLFNFFFQLLLKISVKVPSLILWFPFLFFYAVQVESDLVTMLNSFTKAGIFAFFVYKTFPTIFKFRI